MFSTDGICWDSDEKLLSYKKRPHFRKYQLDLISSHTEIVCIDNILQLLWTGEAIKQPAVLSVYIWTCVYGFKTCLKNVNLLFNCNYHPSLCTTWWHWSPGVNFKARLHNDINWLSFYLLCESGITSLPAEQFLPCSRKEVKCTHGCSYEMTHNFMF